MVALPAVVNPGRAEVLALELEFVLNEDGQSKQDCESAAAERWLQTKLFEHALGRVVVLGDDLYCRQPACKIILDAEHDFVVVCKPNSHQTLYDYLELGPIEEVSLQVGQGKKQGFITYRFAKGLPLRDGEGALLVNWCEITERDAEGKTCYHNAFATNLHLSAQTVVRITTWGRGRWKLTTRATTSSRPRATTSNITSVMASAISPPCSSRC